MGNSLCRERIARADNSKNPIDRIIGRCAQICPANEVKSNYWQKHVLETGPPTRAQPQSTLNDGWRKVTLTVPNGKMSGDGDLGETPIAPPRRKRSSVIDRQPCGFKELFGNNVSRRSSCDSILKDEHPLSEREQEMLQQKRKSKSISDFNLNEIKPTDSLSISTIRIPVTRTLSLMERTMVQQTTIPTPRPTLQRKVSRVGNKKSDKFFGENLSDCLSDDPITPEPEPTSISFTYHTISTLITPIPHTSVNTNDKLDDFVNANAVSVASNENAINDKRSFESNEVSTSIAKPFIVCERVEIKPGEDKKSSLDKKAEFLMAMLEGTNISHMPTDDTKVMTPPRRLHLKKKNSQATQSGNDVDEMNVAIESGHPNENGITAEAIDATDGEALNSQKIPIEVKTIEAINTELGGAKPAIIINDDEIYKGMTPVEEPLIVPRKRPIKHICDDDHHHYQKHIDHNHAPSGLNELNESENKENEPKHLTNAADVEKYIIQQVNQQGITSPVKPKRDLELYEKSHQINAENSTPSSPLTSGDKLAKPSIPRVRHLSQENLLSKKILKTKSNDTIDLLRLKSMQKNNNNYDVTKLNGDNPLESILKKYTSQQSFFTQELLSQIADRVYGFQDPFETSGTCDDGSSKCTPNSKLTTRKISAHRKESTVTRPILENVLEVAVVDSTPKIVQMEHKDPHTINSSSNLNKSEPIVKDTTNTNDEPMKTAIETSTESIVTENIQRKTEDFISAECEHSKVCDKIEMEVNGNVGPTVSECKRINQSGANEANALDDIYKVNSTILDKFQKNFNNNQSDHVYTAENGMSSDDENTDSDTTVKEVSVIDETNPTEFDVENLVLKKLHGGEKRGSIVDVDAWFIKHNDLSTIPRRGSETYVCYDTRKVFPFGKSDPGAGSEFFESKTLSKSAENILNGNAMNVDRTPQINEKNEHFNKTPSATDHSILLKYLK